MRKINSIDVAKKALFAGGLVSILGVTSLFTSTIIDVKNQMEIVKKTESPEEAKEKINYYRENSLFDEVGKISGYIVYTGLGIMVVSIVGGTQYISYKRK